MNNRIKQTARKTTGGKPPSSKKSFFNPPSGGSAAQPHSEPHPDQVKRKSEQKPTVPDVQTHSSAQSRKPISQGNTMKTHSPQETREKDPDRYSANHIRNNFTLTTPTSNIRGDNEEEEDELFSSPSTSHPPRSNVPRWNTEKSPDAKRKANEITKCDRCRNIGSNPACLPYPGSKKCAKCVRDHRTCSWTAGLSGPSSSFEGNSSLKTGPGKAKKTSSEKQKKASDPVQSNINGPSAQAQQNGPKVRQRSISKPAADHILLQCTRCASNANNPICERSDDPKDAKCKKCRRDKQSCSFAPFGKPSAKRKESISAGAAGKGHTDEEDDEGEEEEEQNGSVETSLEGKKKGAEDNAERRTGLDSEESQTRAGGDGSKLPNAAPKKVGKISPVETNRRLSLGIAENQRDTSKRKKDADQDDSEGDRSFSKKKRRPNTTSLDRTIPPASTSNSNESLPVANSNSHHNPHSTFGLPGVHLNETGNASIPSSTTTPRVISVPPAIQGQINGRTHTSRHSASVGSPTVTRPMGQRPEVVELVQDKSIAAIERELRAAEVKAASHRAIAESYLKDADRAEEEVAKLKEELITAVRKNTSLGVEGVAAERKILIEQLLGSAGDQSA